MNIYYIILYIIYEYIHIKKEVSLLHPVYLQFSHGAELVRYWHVVFYLYIVRIYCHE
jgi:hypothetical protein